MALAVEVCGKQQVALSCPRCQCIWLGSQDTEAWSVAWQATGEEGSEERKGQPMPWTMCQGKPGQIITINTQEHSNSVMVIDITRIPFHIVVPEITLGMRATHLCYSELPGVGGVLAVTNIGHENKLCVFSMETRELLWTVGGDDEKGEPVKVAGAAWGPMIVCSDNRGRLYVADQFNHRIIVLSADSGSVLQVVQGRGQWIEEKWADDPGITVYKPDVKYKDDDPMKGVTSGTVLQELKDLQLGEPEYICDGPRDFESKGRKTLSHFLPTFDNILVKLSGTVQEKYIFLERCGS